jgi:hypothetical protein
VRLTQREEQHVHKAAQTVAQRGTPETPRRSGLGVVPFGIFFNGIIGKLEPEQDFSHHLLLDCSTFDLCPNLLVRLLRDPIILFLEGRRNKVVFGSLVSLSFYIIMVIVGHQFYCCFDNSTARLSVVHVRVPVKLRVVCLIPRAVLFRFYGTASLFCEINRVPRGIILRVSQPAMSTTKSYSGVEAQVEGLRREKYDLLAKQGSYDFPVTSDSQENTTAELTTGVLKRRWEVYHEIERGSTREATLAGRPGQGFTGDRQPRRLPN